MNIPEVNLNGFIKFPTKSQKKFKSFKWKVKGGEYVSEGETPDEPDVPDEPDNTGYLCFRSTGKSTIRLSSIKSNAPVLFYSTDKNNWISWDYSTITLNNGERVYFYGENPNGFSYNGMKYSKFTMTGSIAASGNIQTLLSQNGDRMDVPMYCYMNLFNGCTSLTTAPSLPATTLASYCYTSMFEGCTSLIEAPELPSTTIAPSCYSAMFRDCTSLTTTPALPATTLASSCYGSMFDGCTSLTTALELPATTLASRCYASMFTGCTSLTVAPTVLPATTLATYCYQLMFRSCSALTVAPELPATTLVDECYHYMLAGCSALQSVTTHVTDWNTSNTTNWLSDAGTSATNPIVYCPADSTIPSDSNSGIPTSWTRADLPTS